MNENESKEEYIELLQEHCKSCERDRKFGEAQAAKRKIKQLRREKEEGMLQALELQQESKRSEVQDSQTLEFQDFHKAWDNKMHSQRSHAQEQIETFEAIQDEERRQLIDKLDKELPLKPKPSSALLNFYKIETALAKRKDYSEAKAVHKKIKQLETEELRTWRHERQKKIAWQQAHLEKKQEERMNALKIKLNIAEDELEKARVSELEQMLQRFHNAKKELQNYQITQQNKLVAANTLSSIKSIFANPTN